MSLSKGLNLDSTSSALARNLFLLVDQSVAGISLRKGLNLGRASSALGGKLILLVNKALLACLCARAGT